MAEVKVCATCKQEKPIALFPLKKSTGPRGNGKAYPFSICRACVAADEVKKKPPVPNLPTAAEIAAWYRNGCPL